MADYDVAALFPQSADPHSDNVEQCVLGSILVAPEKLNIALDYLTPEAFGEELHRELFRLMMLLFSGANADNIDMIIVLNEAVRHGIFENEAEGKRYLAHLAYEVPTPDNIESYCRIVAENYSVRQLADVARDLLREIAAGSEPAQTLLDSAEQRIYDIRQGRDVRGLVPIKDVVLRTYRHLEDLSGPEREKYLGAKTGYDDLDAITGGMNNSDLIILAARPGMGKTSFALNLSKNVAQRSGRTVAIYSLEMSDEQLVSRMLSTEACVDSYKLRTGKLSREEWIQLGNSAQILSRLNICLADRGGISVSSMKAQLRRIKDLGMVVIDYLQLMSAPNKNDNRVQEISAITRNLKLMAKELNVPVLLLSQLNRGVESRTDKRPMMSDLRESGSIEQDADIIMFLYNDYYYYREKSQTPNITECIVSKNRHGDTSTIKLVWDAQYTRFSSLAREEAPPQ